MCCDFYEIAQRKGCVRLVCSSWRHSFADVSNVPGSSISVKEVQLTTDSDEEAEVPPISRLNETLLGQSESPNVDPKHESTRMRPDNPSTW